MPFIRTSGGSPTVGSISYWDAAILEAARTQGCKIVLSEDLSDGQDYDGVRVENPFSSG
ncbi:MAG: hypothetical protein ABR992_18910 [Solirubrobacteraceae bacterium]